MDHPVRTARHLEGTMLRRPRCPGLFLLIGLATTSTTPLHGQQPGACAPSRDSDPAALLHDAISALGADGLGGAVVHLRATEATVENYQSDRAYPPFFL